MKGSQEGTELGGLSEGQQQEEPDELQSYEDDLGRRRPIDNVRLRPSNKIYGRSVEQALVVEEYNKAIRREGPNSLVIVSGSSDRTWLVESLQEVVEHDGGFFISWRFNPFNALMDYDGFDVGVTGLCSKIAKSPFRDQIAKSIRSAGPIDCAILLDMIPPIKGIIGEKEYSGGHKSVESSGRLLHAMQHFLRSIKRPIVCLLDELQHADSSSLDTISNLILALETSEILFVATIGLESNEKFEGFLAGLGNSVRQVNVELEDLQEADINAMVADMLHVTPDVSLPMSRLIFEQTGGNIVFAEEFLRLMHASGGLQFDDETKTWHGDDDAMNSIYPCPDFETLISTKVATATDEFVDMLKTVACFGTRIETHALRVICTSSDVTNFIDTAVELGLIVLDDKFREIYRFSNPGLHRGAYSLIPEAERVSYHARIGRNFVEKLTKEEELFGWLATTLGQLKMGEECLKKEKERFAVADLSVRGAQKALAWSGFHIAHERLQFGLSMLDENSWSESYAVTLAVHSVGAELAFSIGSFSRALKLADATIRNANGLDDKLQAYCTKMDVLSSLGDTKATVDEGIDILEQLGECFPTNPGPRDVKKEVAAFRRSTKNKTPDFLVRLPTMTNERTATIVRILDQIFNPAAFLAYPFLAALLVIRAMRITLQHGLCAVSASIFAGYGMLLCGHSGDIEEGTVYGDVALRLLDRFGAREWAARTYNVVYGGIYCYTKDIWSCMEHLNRAQLTGRETGNSKDAALIVTARSMFMFVLGQPLPSLRQDLDAISNDLKKVNQTGALELLAPLEIMYAILLDSGGGRDSLEQLREGADSHSESSPSLKSGWDAFFVAMVAFLLGDSKLALEHSRKAIMLEDMPFHTMDIAAVYLFYGLSQLAHYRATGKSKRKSISVARSLTKKLERLAKFNPHYCAGKVLLIKAEIASLTGKHDVARMHYVTSAAMFDSEKLLIELALAKELTGRHMLRRGDSELGKLYLEQSVEAFLRWGVRGKATMLTRELEALSVPPSTPQ